MIKDDLDLISLADLKSELLQDSDTQHHYLELQARKTLVQDLKLAGIQAKHMTKLQIQLTALNVAQSPNDMSTPSWKLHPLKEVELKGQWSISVNSNWRLTFKFEGEDAILVDYQDYH